MASRDPERSFAEPKTGLVATGIGAVATGCTSPRSGMYTSGLRNSLIVSITKVRADAKPHLPSLQCKDTKF